MVDKVLEQKHPIKAVKLPNDKRKLEAIANATQGDIAVWEGGIIMPLMFMMLAISIVILAWQEALHGGSPMTVTLMGLTAAFLLFLLLRTILRRQLPFFILTPEGLQCSVFKTVVPWRGIEDFQINSSKTNAMNIAVEMEFFIIPRYVPECADKPRAGCYYEEDKSKVVMSGFNFQLSTNRDTIIAQINSYRNAALARHKLQMDDYK